MACVLYWNSCGCLLCNSICLAVAIILPFLPFDSTSLPKQAADLVLVIIFSRRLLLSLLLVVISAPVPVSAPVTLNPKAALQGCWRAVGASFGKSITFKTTLKGSNMLMKNGLGDLWMPCVCFLGLLASLGFGLHKVCTCNACLVHNTKHPIGLAAFPCHHAVRQTAAQPPVVVHGMCLPFGFASLCFAQDTCFVALCTTSYHRVGLAECQQCSAAMCCSSCCWVAWIVLLHLSCGSSWVDILPSSASDSFFGYILIWVNSAALVHVQSQHIYRSSAPTTGLSASCSCA